MDYKKSAVQYYLRTHNQTKTCDVYQCSERSLMRWVNRYNTNSLERINKTRKAYKVTNEHVRHLMDVLGKQHQITLDDLHNIMIHKYEDFTITKQHMGKIIRDNNRTYKRVKVRHIPLTRFGKAVDVSGQLNDFYAVIEKYNPNDIICIDETSIGSGSTRNYCRSMIGARCTKITTSQEVFKHYTGIFAIGANGCVGWELYDKGGITADRMEEFYNKYISKFKNKLIIMDNASSHRNERIRALYSKQNRLLLTVPYQHFTNAIENWFSVFKTQMDKENTLSLNNIKIAVRRVTRKIRKSVYGNIIHSNYTRKSKYVDKSMRYMRKQKTYKNRHFKSSLV